MTLERTERKQLPSSMGRWITGVVAGAVGALGAAGLLYLVGAFQPAEVGVDAWGILFMPGAVFGLLYVGLVSLGGLDDLAGTPRTGIVLGCVYGLLFGLTTVVGSAFTPSTVFAGVIFGCVIGGLYALSPYTQ